MVKKGFIGLGILGAVLFILLLAARFTGAFQYYNIPTPANEPALKPGDKVFTSNLKQVQSYQFIVFTSKYADSANASYMPDFKTGSIYLYRLCGIDGDIIEMKNSTLFVNKKNFDESLDLKNQYLISNTEFNLIDQEDVLTSEASGNFIQRGDSAIVGFDNYLIKKYQSKIKLNPFIFTNIANDCFKWYDKNTTWTTDNFGPIEIPSNCYFVLGDNRHNAMDSRYIGFVKKENIKGVVLNK